MIFNRRDTKKTKRANTYEVKSCNVSQVVENQIDEIKQKDIDKIMMMNQKKNNDQFKSDAFHIIAKYEK